MNFRKAFQNTLESLQEIYAALPDNWKMFVEYKAFEPNFYSMTVGDWGQSLLYANKLGPKAYTLVDLGHHLPNANIEQIVSLLLMEGKLADFISMIVNMVMMILLLAVSNLTSYF